MESRTRKYIIIYRKGGKKMKDNEIIKALECCCAKENCEVVSCEKCPLEKHYECTDIMFHETLDLINRKNAEIEMLKDLIIYQKQEIKEKEQKYNQAVDDMFGLIETTRNEIAEAKSEAIKEFAHFVIDKSRNGVIYASDIPDLVKEMTECER